METVNMCVEPIVKDVDNVLFIDAVPTERTVCSLFTLSPNTEKDAEALEISFDEDYNGDLSVKICSLMAEDFHVDIDGGEYSYAIRGAGQTDPGYAMIAGPFEKGTVIGCSWGKPSASVYTQEDIGNVEAHGEPDEKGKPVVVPFFVSGAQSVTVSKTFAVVLADVTEQPVVSIAPFGSIPLLADGVPVEEEFKIAVPEDAVYKSIKIVAGKNEYNFVIRNSKNKNDNEQCPDAFMNVTGSFAGELCYKVGEADEGCAKGTYHTDHDRVFGADPFTGYLWGRNDDKGSSWSFQVEEGLYEFTVVLYGASEFNITTQGKEKKYNITSPEEQQDGPTSSFARLRCGNGIVTVNALTADGDNCPIGSIEIRTLSTTASASDYVPAVMPSEETSDGSRETAEESSMEEPAYPEHAEESSMEEPADPEHVEESSMEASVDPEREEESSMEAPADPEREEESSMEAPADPELGEEKTTEAEKTEESATGTIAGSENKDEAAEEEHDVACGGSDITESGEKTEIAPEEKKVYSNRSVPLSEHEYRAAIENYFGPGKHGIDFWDSERKERPGDTVGRPEPKRKAEPAPEQKAEPAPEQKAEPTPEQKTEPAPEQKAEPAPEQKAEPAPEQKTEPAPEQKAEPAPEQKTEPAPEQKAEPTPEQKAEPAPETRQIRVSVYSSSSRRNAPGSGGLSGFLSSLVKKKK
ncbi:MAG: hypothetical protein K5655_08935 [Lachnospiraceae bacterium]|nr:hypothetical protein [Lachnospiraceae bacterium]